MEDSDIKIFGAQPKPDEEADELRLIRQMETQRANGNIDKAAKLGDYLSDIFLNEDELLRRLSAEVGALDYPAAVIHQIKILMFFAAEYCINRELPNTILKSTAINALYGNIKYGDAAFYEEFSDGGEYSFYYLAMRKETRNVLQEIGRTFSMLCGKEDDPAFVELGRRLFNLTEEEVENIIQIFDFKTM
ncbi:MAG TPA: hypothetical protein IAC53_05115 [Candidatus Fimenecus excrementigallinarum]|uniref:Uncharacterized protein n=1 Tax=Candidatus Fimenecus excrementigallinarum TaxID=2840816 RepID=A0A9D1IES8_9FIRM|nr:hypothetical protein [Candidatus Fimenecus excrementigallinarum]